MDGGGGDPSGTSQLREQIPVVGMSCRKDCKHLFWSGGDAGRETVWINSIMLFL